jgi:hypothetical protein
VDEAHAYLTEIYGGRLDAASKALMHFFVDCYKEAHNSYMLEFGGGPALYSVISAARWCACIHFTDHSLACLAEIRRWHSQSGNAFDWSEFVHFALECERDGGMMTGERVADREALIRSKMRKITYCDAFASDLLCGVGRSTYDIVANNFCLEGITQDRETWLHMVRKLSRLVAGGGQMVTTAVRNGRFWEAGSKRFSCASIGLKDLKEAYLLSGFEVIQAKELDLPHRAGYDGILMVNGRRFG